MKKLATFISLAFIAIYFSSILTNIEEKTIVRRSKNVL